MNWSELTCTSSRETKIFSDVFLEYLSFSSHMILVFLVCLLVIWNFVLFPIWQEFYFWFFLNAKDDINTTVPKLTDGFTNSMGIHLLQGLSYHQGAEETKCEAYQWKSYLNRCDFVWPRTVSLKSLWLVQWGLVKLGLGCCMMWSYWWQDSLCTAQCPSQPQNNLTMQFYEHYNNLR